MGDHNSAASEKELSEARLDALMQEADDIGKDVYLIDEGVRGSQADEHSVIVAPVKEFAPSHRNIKPKLPPQQTGESSSLSGRKSRRGSVEVVKTMAPQDEHSKEKEPGHSSIDDSARFDEPLVNLGEKKKAKERKEQVQLNESWALASQGNPDDDDDIVSTRGFDKANQVPRLKSTSHVKAPPNPVIPGRIRPPSLHTEARPVINTKAAAIARPYTSPLPEVNYPAPKSNFAKKRTENRMPSSIEIVEREPVRASSKERPKTADAAVNRQTTRQLRQDTREQPFPNREEGKDVLWDEEFTPYDSSGQINFDSPLQKVEKLNEHISYLEKTKSWSNLIPKLIEKLALVQLADGFESVGVIVSMNELADCYIHNRLYRTALNHLANAVQISNKLLIGDSDEIGISKREKDVILSKLLLSRGRCYTFLLQPKLASTDLKLAMQLHQRSFIQDSNENGQESESLCVYWLSLANLYIIEEQYIKAYELVKKLSDYPGFFSDPENNIYELMKKLLIEFSADKTRAMEGIDCGGLLLNYLSKHEDALRKAKVQVSMAKIYLDIGDFKNARTYIEPGRQVYEEMLGIEDRRTRRLIEDEAKCLIQAGLYERAGDLLGQVLAFLERDESSQPAEQGAVHRLLGRIKQDTNDLKLAEFHYQAALQIFIAKHGKDHVASRKIMANLANVRQRLMFDN